MCAAIAIPAFSKYMRRSKTSEARVQIAKMFDAASSYYEEHGKCPSDGSPNGAAPTTPPLGLNCNQGPRGRCVPQTSGAGGYESELWSGNPVWSQLNFQQEQGHYFHYRFVWETSAGPQGSGCEFTVQAFADLDDDGVFSTYERSGAADRNGINAAAGLYIDRSLE